MGKSDSLIFPEYIKILPKLSYQTIAFLGFSSENDFTKRLEGKDRHFYDLSIGNWNINDSWSLNQKYDLIVCTRCAYFSKNPKIFIEKCKEYLKDDGIALVDWGLGDHWRFKNFKVGWVRDGEHEYAYNNDNFLYSCFWNDDLLKDENVNYFWSLVKSNTKFQYQNENISDTIKREVPAVVSYETIKISTVTLWPDNPQLYIITLFGKEKNGKV